MGSKKMTGRKRCETGRSSMHLCSRSQRRRSWRFRRTVKKTARACQARHSETGSRSRGSGSDEELEVRFAILMVVEMCVDIRGI